MENTALPAANFCYLFIQRRLVRMCVAPDSLPGFQIFLLFVGQLVPGGFRSRRNPGPLDKMLSLFIARYVVDVVDGEQHQSRGDQVLRLIAARIQNSSAVSA